MNSYPIELVAQLAPVMFVGGLDIPPTSSDEPDSFTDLALRLRETLLPRRKQSIYDISRKFQIHVVDKTLQFPPRKASGAQDDPNAHSPLSPLTPTSPLHPDGLIAPIWIRKHTTLVPSVFVMFMRIFESTNEDEREKDAELAAEISLRKRTTNERSIKLTVVLLTSRQLLDSPSLDSRLTYIRRQSGLDSRAALFVLSPVSQKELEDFVGSLEGALWDPAMEYYTNHSKRVRRKRNRHQQQTTVSYPLALPTNVPRPLRPEGWTVRYEFKLATFAEFRHEYEVALKHYQDGYSNLIILFGSPLNLPPRTKRWAEAKVLADCINMKIVKLYLYNGETSLALAQHRSHVIRFGDFSRGWGIGESTFEFWSWGARQWRVIAEMGELVDQAVLGVPKHNSLGVNPSQVFFHPGFYYLLAARYTEKRRERFLEAVSHGDEQGPGFTNERKLDHLGIALELYTKAYQLFKKNDAGGGRLPLLIALNIAQTHLKSGEYKTGIQFFERIAPAYRKEAWWALLGDALGGWWDAVHGSNENSLEILVERIALDNSIPAGQDLVEELIALLKSMEPRPEPLVIDIPPQSQSSIISAAITFYKSHVNIQEPAPFQLHLNGPGPLPIEEIVVDLVLTEEVKTTVRISHIASSDPKTGARLVDLGKIDIGSSEPTSIEADLRWKKGQDVVFYGWAMCPSLGTLKADHITIVLEGSVHLRSTPSPTNRWLVAPPKFIDVPAIATLSIQDRAHNLHVDVMHSEPALIGDEYRIEIAVENVDERDIEVVVDILLQPMDGGAGTITLETATSPSYIKGVPFGLLKSGDKVSKSLTLLPTGLKGDRILDISIQSSMSETLHTLTVSTIDPFHIDFQVEYTQPTSMPALLDLQTFERDFNAEWTATVETRVQIADLGHSSIEIDKVELKGVVEGMEGVYVSEDEFAWSSILSLEPGAEVEISWRRCTGDSKGSLSTTKFPLPPLRPPISSALGALISFPATASLHQPFKLTLTIQNHSLSSAAVQIALEDGGSFVISGLRIGKIPILLPDSEETLSWQLIPVECGHIALPIIKVTTEGEDIDIKVTGQSQPGVLDQVPQTALTSAAPLTSAVPMTAYTAGLPDRPPAVHTILVLP